MTSEELRFQREYEEAEAFLRGLGYPTDLDLLNATSPYMKVSAVALLLGLSDFQVRARAEAGEFPGAILYPDPQTGWRIPRFGVVIYLARMRRQTEQRQQA